MTTFNELIDIWYDGCIAQLWDGPADVGNGLLMGCPAWDKAYVERLVNYCLPSIACGSNLKALAGKARLVIFTDQANLTKLAFTLQGLEHRGIELRIKMIPEEVIKAWEEATAKGITGAAYPMLACVQDVCLRAAGRAGMSYHMVMPDHSYPQDFFANVERLAVDHHGIAHLGMSTDEVGACKRLESFRQPDGSLAVPALELGTIGWQNLHPRMKAFVMDASSMPDRMPLSHFMAWRARDKVVLSSCHMNVAYLSAQLCAKAPKVYPATIDTELPQLMGPAGYVPTVDDGLTFIELSGPDKAYPETRAPIEKFMHNAWMQARFRVDYLDWTRRRCVIPVKPQAGADFMSDQQIQDQHDRIINLMLDARPQIALEIVQGLWRKGKEPQVV